MVEGDSPDWPPPGWTEDVKLTNGRKIKYYTNVETGKKFYSKKEVTRYMNTKDTCHDVTQAMNYQVKSCSENNVSQMNYQDKSCSENNVSQIVEGTKNSHEWLPPGWIVELKTRKSGSHAGMTYKVYVDPSTGSKFYSKPEVSKYLKTMKQNNIAGEGQIHGNGEVSYSNQKVSEDSENIGGQSCISKRQKSDTNQSMFDIEEGSFPEQKASQDSEEVGELSCIPKRKKSGIERPSTKTSPSHGAGEDFPLSEKTSLGSKENGPQSPLPKRQKPGSDILSAKSVCSVAVDCDSVDVLPPGWKKEVIIRQNDRGIRKDPPTTDDISLKKSGCFVTGTQPFATDESKGEKSFGTCSPVEQVENTKKQLDCSVSDPNTIITSILAEINEKHSFENVIGDAEIETASVGVTQPSATSTQSDLLPEKQLSENKQEKHSYKAVTPQSRKSRNTESLTLGRRVSKRLAGQNPEMAANLDLSEHTLPAVVEKSASPSLSPNVCGQELLQHSDPTPETGNSDQASLSGEAPLDELPPGWKKEIKITKKARGIRKDPLYIDPVHGYVFRSKKDVLRYLQTGDINRCAIRPVKRDLDATMKESSPATPNINLKKLECSVIERQSFGAKESKGGKHSVTYSLKIQAESSKKQSESGVSNASSIIASSAADINLKHSNESVIECAEISLDTEPEIRDSSADTKVIAAESVTVKRLSAVSTFLSGLLAEQQLPENEQENHINKEKVEQSRRSRTKKPLTPARRTSKRLVGHSPEAVADLDLGERAFRAVVKKSASLGIPLDVCGQELAQNKDPTVVTGNSDQASLSREASGDELPPCSGKEIHTQNKDPTVTTGNSDQAFLTREASGDELPPGSGKEILIQNKGPTVATGNSDLASLSREASGDELPPGSEKEILTQNKDPTVATRNSNRASLNREASGDELPPGSEKQILTQNKGLTVATGNYDQASLRREGSLDKIPPGWEKEILVQNKNPTVGTGTSGQAFLSRKFSLDEIPPGWEKEIPAQNTDSTVVTGNSDQASMSREASLDEIPPGWEKDILARNKNSSVGTGNSYQASQRREASVDDIPPGWEKEILSQNNDPTVGTGNSDKSFLSRGASMDELPPGWKKKFRIRKTTCGIKKDPFYTDPVHGYVFRSKKDVMRYLQSGDIRSCAIRPTKKDPDSTMKDNSSSTHDTSSVELGCSLTRRRLSTTEESKGRKFSVTCSLALQAESSNEHPESSVFNPNTSISSIVADITEKYSRENVNEDAEIRLDVEPEIRDSIGDTKAIVAESVNVRRSLAVSTQLKFLPEQQLPENEKEKRSNKGVPVRSRKFSNSKSSPPVRRVSKRLPRHNPEVVADLDLGEHALRAVVNNSASSGLPLNVFDHPSLTKKASSRDDPLEIVKCLSEDQAFKEQKVMNKLTSEKQNDERILQDSQPAGISHESGKVHLEHQAIKERLTGTLAKEEQDSLNRFLKNSQPAELAWESRIFPAEDRSVSERSTIEQVTEKRDDENKQWQDSQLAEPSWRRLDLNVENQQWQDPQLAEPSHRSVDLNVENQQWQDPQLAEPSQRSVDLNVENKPAREKQTGELVTENQDEQNRRLHAQLASYPFGDYWLDPCLEFAFKTLTGAISVEDTLAFQGSAHQEYNTSYTQADDGCFELPLFNTSSFYTNDVPNHCAPSEEHVTKEQPPINQTFLPTGNNSTPGCSSVISQNPGLDTQAKDYQSKFKPQR